MLSLRQAVVGLTQKRAHNTTLAINLPQLDLIVHAGRQQQVRRSRKELDGCNSFCVTRPTNTVSDTQGVRGSTMCEVVSWGGSTEWVVLQT